MLEATANIPFVAPDERPILHPRQKARRDAIKAAGGVEYDVLLDRERAARAKWKLENPERHRELRRAHKKGKSFKAALCLRARRRGRKRGLVSTIRPDDLVWPTHCPVLGIKLDYPERAGMRGDQPTKADWPSLDRWDNSKGYVPGNVFVVSHRANTIKGDATYEEFLLVAKYLSEKPRT